LIKKEFAAAAAVLVLAAITLSTFVGCGQSGSLAFGQTMSANDSSPPSLLDSSLVGRWVRDGKDIRNSSANMDLLKDKTGLCDYGGDGKGAAMVWKVENGRFYEMYGTSGYVWNFKISGQTLTLTNGNGESTTYKKQP